ncbi:MAG: putative hydrolase [Methanosaeta sp. PtaU1.Bin112]|nr:MAG: putative hydrolase [Methanosaeta sp. PtaU1.Bin112]
MSPESFDLNAWLDDIRLLYRGADPAHDISHVLRVYRNARIIGQEEGADMRVLLWAALLHDVASEKKDDCRHGDSEDRGKRSAEAFLEAVGLDEAAREKVQYAVDVHRFSRGIIPVTLEARVLQDADRLDAIGAIGIARLFLTGGVLGREFYHPDDPFCRSREPDDGKWNLDHFYKKLLKLESGMHTESGKRMAARRTAVLRRYLQDLEAEIAANGSNSNDIHNSCNNSEN